MFELTSIYCPECGDFAEDVAPEDWREPGPVPDYRHAGDRTPLCLVMTRVGYRPAEPVERIEDEAGTR